MKDVNNSKIVVEEEFLDPKYGLYKFYDFPKRYIGPNALITQTNNRNWVWHERLRHLNFRTLKLMVKHDTVDGLPKHVPRDGVCEGCVLGTHH